MSRLTWVRAVAGLSVRYGDLLVVHALADQGEDFAFALGGHGQAVVGSAFGGAGGGELGDESAGDAWGQKGVAGGDDLNGVQ